ncbi:MAG TPA: glycine zipper domain-containing protein [Coxiellaceae bacterium]|nr:glycine zipper domain-containing protein [Coxiellaceae bacterium]
MRKLALAGILSVMAFEMTSCTPGNNVPGATATGALAGGLIGNQIFHGRNAFAGVIAGALIGGVIGNRIGVHMDEQDKINMQSAIIHTPVNQEATWTSNQAGPNGEPVTYQVKPTRVYTSQATHRYCREYQTTVTVGGKTEQAFGKACRMPDGQWKIVK